jgi:outer membrane protein OmpA-like peptidoglycan-associated protein
VALPEPLNGSRNDATVAIRADGNGMIIYRDETNGGDLYACDKTGDGWSTPKPLPPTVNSPGQESSAWRTADGNWLYFVSSREGGVGGSDIYRSKWDFSLGNWGTAENLGPDINTIYDEEGVYLTPDGKTLYFASQGHNSMGGYDLFKSTLEGEAWSRPVNLGWPINSPGDDQFLVFSSDGLHGYFNSVRPGGMGEDDLYQVQMEPETNVDETAMLVSAGNAMPMADKEQQMRLIGFIKGLKMMQPINATVDLMSLDEPAFNATFRTDPATGGFVAQVPAGQDYAVHVNADGYLLHSEHVANSNGEIHIDMGLKTLDAGNTEVMRNIFFRSNSHDLDSASTEELNMLVDFLNRNPKLRIEIGGHTDSDHGPVPNQPLSEARAYVVLNWLVAHGIDPDRLEAKGYGDTKPLVPNTDAKSMALNRRTEIRVL